ncbi:hypothetical protein FQA39_LY15567 [Lamprigera yunnana]|nr:hypothetical protein FQA39_LY15567 [Lamprigera yunnana]
MEKNPDTLSVGGWAYIWVIIKQYSAHSIEDTTEVEYSVSSSTSIGVGSSTKRSNTVTESAARIDHTFQGHNQSRDGLDQSASEHESVIFVDNNSGYIPVPALRHRNIAPTVHDDLDWQHPVETWDREYRRFRWNNTKVQHIEAECQDDYMKIRVGFNGTFTGLVYSAGTNLFEQFRTFSSFSLSCYVLFYLRKLAINSLIVATGNPVVFTLTPPECYMEIRYGYGTNGNRVTGPVRVGDPLTLIIYMRSKYDGFDIVVNDCFAHNGANKKIQLIDEFGCPVDDKLISRFRGSWSEAGIFETQVFAYMKTFRFTGSPALYIECDVRMCHGRCPSQPCHWRNVNKSISKRSIDDTNSTVSPPLSENVNLFQSLRVLQEGENEDDDNGLLRRVTNNDPNQVCLKTGWFSVLLALGASIVCLLSGALLATCSRIRRGAIDKVLTTTHFDGYMAHKGGIN